MTESQEDAGPAGGRDEQAVRRFVEQLALVFAAWGFPRMAARVLFALMTTDAPGLTAPGLAQALDASPAAISGSVRYLIQLGLLVREPVPGSRRDLYRVRDDAWYAGSLSKSGLFQTIDALGRPTIEALGGPETVPGARVADMLGFLNFLDVEMALLLKRWEQMREPTEPANSTSPANPTSPTSPANPTASTAPTTDA